MATAAPAQPWGPPSCCAFLYLLLPLLFLFYAEPVNSDVGLITSMNKSSICKSMDIRNSLAAFEELRGCQVIEGFLSILLFDNVDEIELANISFPELIEITDYLILFRVKGLKSIGQLFPNLAIIRGQNLFIGGKALVIFEMTSLQEIGLHSLTDIMRGIVYIDKNPSLCFVNTIDWNAIVHDDPKHNFLKSLKPENECPVCPPAINGRKCPRNEKENRNLCWNTNHCQKICPKNCTSGTCNDRGICCNKSCVGGCGEDDPDKCVLCRNFISYTPKNDLDAQPKCVDTCPANYYKYLGRRCVTKSECVNMTGPIDFQSNNVGPTIEIKHPYKAFNNSCMIKCPSSYADDYNEHTCKKCNNTCRKECPGMRIDSINMAEQLHGCTHITSFLEIQIRGGNNVVKQLEENLGMIEEIDGYLKIVRSFSLVSLNFFKNLKRIRGKQLESQRYSFVVLDNENLQSLFDWDSANSTQKSFKIDRGRLFFHFNPKLCIEVIQRLSDIANLEQFSDMEVALNSNGDKVACNVTNLNVEVSQIQSKQATLKWAPFELDDPRKLLSYIVYRVEAPGNTTVNYYDGRDACGQDNWHVDDVQNKPDANDANITITHTLEFLKPYTRYAVYVKTYTIATERSGAMSQIFYIQTHPAQPSIPKGLQVYSNSSDSLIVTWLPPSEPNGVIEKYIITVTKRNSSADNNRDYCKDVVSSAETTTKKPPPSVTVTQKSKDTCDSNIKPNQLNYDEQEELNRINFENALHNRVYVKRKDSPRTKRSPRLSNEIMIDKNFKNSTILQTNELDSEENYETKYTSVENTTDSFTINVTAKSNEFYEHNYLITNLHHNTKYDISLKACRLGIENDSEPRCSDTTSQIGTTEKKVGADVISAIKVMNVTLDSVTVLWTQPPDPNGMIVSYTILYKREGTKNAQYIGECISFKDFKNFTNNNSNMTYTISKLYSGNHSLCIKASSFAGPGDTPNCVSFVIPEQTSNFLSLTYLIVLVIFVCFMAGGFWFYRKTMKERNIRLIPSVNPEYMPTVYIPDEWEVSRKQVELVKELGQGSFGMVWEGLAYDIRNQPSMRCAVKTVNEHATNRERVDFLNEASIMKGFDTTHVVKLLGVVSHGQPTLVIMELMAQGDLKTYLRSHRPENNDGKPSPTLKQILQMAIEIADGMAYLEAKKFVHRDLAARNCMVSDLMTVKIGDFGMTRDIYETDYYRKGSKGLLPVRWMAPESLKDGVFSSSSDVWSYGVVLWEMATLASQPYQGLANDQVLRYVIDGGVMERPENCPDKLYELMRHCWNSKPGRRPTFMTICQLLLPDANQQFAKVSFYHSPAGNEARIARAAAVTNAENGEMEGDDADVSTPLNALPPDVRIVGYGISASERSDSIQSVQMDPNPRFYSVTGENRTANGFAGGRTRNGTAQSQC